MLDNEEWWKCKTCDECVLTYHSRYEIINELLRSISHFDFMILPIIFKGGQSIDLDAYLPPMHSRTWLFVDNINDFTLFYDIQKNEHFKIVNKRNVPDDIYFDLLILKRHLLEEKGYFGFKRIQLRKDGNQMSNKKDGSQVSKFDLSGVKSIGVLASIEGDMLGDIISNGKSYKQDLDFFVKEIIKTNDEKSMRSLLQEADKYLADQDESECKVIVEKTVNEHINSEESKKSFLQKIKQFSFDVSTSFLGGILVEAVKVLVFGA